MHKAWRTRAESQTRTGNVTGKWEGGWESVLGPIKNSFPGVAQRARMHGRARASGPNADAVLIPNKRFVSWKRVEEHRSSWVGRWARKLVGRFAGRRIKNIQKLRTPKPEAPQNPELNHPTYVRTPAVPRLLTQPSSTPNPQSVAHSVLQMLQLTPGL